MSSPTYPYVKSGKLTLADFIKRNKIEFSKDIIKEANLTLLYNELKEFFQRPGTYM